MKLIVHWFLTLLSKKEQRLQRISVLSVTTKCRSELGKLTTCSRAPPCYLLKTSHNHTDSHVFQ